MDTLFLLEAPFDGTSRKFVETPLRFESVTWGDRQLALIEERRWKDRKRIMLAVSPDAAAPPVTLFDGSFEDRYHDPGQPFTAMNSNGKRVLQTTPNSHGIYLRGEGASPDGDRPFVAVMGVSNGESKRLWQSTDKYFELPVAVLETEEPKCNDSTGISRTATELLHQESGGR